MVRELGLVSLDGPGVTEQQQSVNGVVGRRFAKVGETGVRRRENFAASREDAGAFSPSSATAARQL
jgi:hypothetical protein